MTTPEQRLREIDNELLKNNSEFRKLVVEIITNQDITISVLTKRVTELETRLEELENNVGKLRLSSGNFF